MSEPGQGDRTRERATSHVDAWIALGAGLLGVLLAGLAAAANAAPAWSKYLGVPQRLMPEELADYSPLYLGLARLLGESGLQVLHVALHGLVAACVATGAARLAGRRWAVAAGVFAAAYRPFLAHVPVAVPESLVLGLLAAAVALGLVARDLLGRAADRPAALAACGSVLVLALAAAARPAWILVLPLWAVWLGAGAPHASRRLARVTVLAVSFAVLGPLFIARTVQGGSPLVLAPGPAFYEGNGPVASGVEAHAPEPVQRIRDQGEVPDDDEAYRRIASFVKGRLATTHEMNAYWAGLAFDGMRERPGASAARFARKLVASFEPRERHDLAATEWHDRRLRGWLPWGFGVLLLGVPWIAVARRRRLVELAGPLALLAVAVLSQVVFFVSSGGRAPLALALLFVVPALAGDLVGSRLRCARTLALAVGLVFAALVTWNGARRASLDRESEIAALGAPDGSVGESLSGWLDGSRWSPAGATRARLRDAITVVLAEDEQAVEAALADLEALAQHDPDLTSDDRTLAVPRYWRTRALLVLGRRAEAAEESLRAVRDRPGDVSLRALSHRLTGPERGRPIREIDDWSVPGTDPVSERWAQVLAAVLDGDERRAAQLTTRFVPVLAELSPLRIERAR